MKYTILKYITLKRPILSHSFFFVLFFLMALAGSDAFAKSKKKEVKSAEDLYIVDCLLPAKVRKLGKMTYLGPKRPIKTTAVDCSIRGGDYVAYDRADYRTALNVWLEQAKDGDAEAQNYVGEIFEKGLGTTPDYQAAAQWYQKAVDQGFERAMVNLGYLYEKGLGVEKNVAVALNFYRKGSGLENDTLVFDSQAKEELAKAQLALNKKMSDAKIQAKFLKKQIQELEESVQVAQPSNSESTQQELEEAKLEIATLKELYSRTETEKSSLSEQLSGLSLAYRNVRESPLLSPETIQTVDERILKDMNFGRYFAVIIGNQDYLYLDDLRSPLRDANRLKKILEDKYGFTTLVLPNADEKIILNTLNDLNKQLSKNDNLLIYYAGHGNISESQESSRERGYWLPIDARSDNITHWINNAVISDHLDRLKARSVLVVADSCFAGQLGAEGSSFLFGSGAKLSKKSLHSGLSHRSRIVISSGGVKPVLDGTTSDHSVFTESLLDVLESNDQILRDSMVFSHLAVNVKERNNIIGADSSPEMKPIRSAGHEGGVFYFVPGK